jgi:hypothetical protein
VKAFRQQNVCKKDLNNYERHNFPQMWLKLLFPTVLSSGNINIESLTDIKKEKSEVVGDS